MPCLMFLLVLVLTHAQKVPLSTKPSLQLSFQGYLATELCIQIVVTACSCRFSLSTSHIRCSTGGCWYFPLLHLQAKVACLNISSHLHLTGMDAPWLTLVCRPKLCFQFPFLSDVHGGSSVRTYLHCQGHDLN